MNIDENESRLEVPFPKKCIQYKNYCDDFKIPQKVAAKRYGYGLSSFNDMVKYLYRINDISEIKSLYDDGMTDKTTLKALIRHYIDDEEHCKSLIDFAIQNDCVNREFLTKSIKVDKEEFKELLETEVSNNEAATINDNSNLEGDSKDQMELSGVGSNDEQDNDNTEPLETGKNPEQAAKIVESLSGIGVTARKPGKAELAFRYKGDVYFLEMEFLPQEEDKILLRNIQGDHVLAEKNECKLEYVS